MSRKILTYEIVHDESKALKLTESGNKEDYKKISLPCTDKYSRNNADCSLAWEDTDKRTYVTLYKGDLNVTDYLGLGMWIYSAKKTGARIKVCLFCQYSESYGKTSYAGGEFTVNFEGWKFVKLDKSDFGNAYFPDLTHVSSITILSSGWGIIPDPETALYIDSVQLLPKGSIKCNFDPNEIKESDYNKIKENLIRFENGGVNYKRATGEIKEKLSYYIEVAKNDRKEMRRGDCTPFEADMTTTAGITYNYTKIYNMARGYSVEGGEIYKDKKLLDDILYALEYMHENYYKSPALHEYPTRNNWWDWEIGSPYGIVQTLMFIEKDIPRELIDRYLEPVNVFCPVPTNTMANRVDIAYITFSSGALQHDYEKLLISRDALDECCDYVESGDGFYTDGSFIQHVNVPYTGSYGPIMLDALSKIIYSTNDTCFRFKENMIDCQYKWAVESFIPLMFHGAFFGLVRGRSVTRDASDVHLGIAAVVGMTRMTKYLGERSKVSYLKSVLKEYYAYNGATYRKRLSPFDLYLLDEILSEQNPVERVDYTFAHMFSRMDRPIAQYATFGCGVALSSERISKYESFHNENTKGWYTGDGMLYVYTTVNDYSPLYWKKINSYRIPGTTVTTAIRTTPEQIGYTLPKKDFVGGCELDGTLAVCMDFESKACGFESTLEGRKGWFIFSNEIICLGSNINCEDEYNVETIIENRIFGKSKEFKADGNTVIEQKGTLKGNKILYVENFGSIYLPNETEINFNRTNDETEFLELYINHGNKPQKAKYSYVILPLLSEQESIEFAENPDFTILSNDENLMAVRNRKKDIDMYIFYKAGEFENIKTDKPCIVSMTKDKIAVCDPTQKLNEINVSVENTLYKFTDLTKGKTDTKMR